MDVYSTILQSEYFKIIMGFLVGGIIGLERQFTAEELGERMPGVRTFGLLSLLGTISVMLAKNYGFIEAPLLGSVFAIALIILFSVFRSLYYVKDTGITTPVALSISFFIGLLVGYGEIVLSLTLSIFVTFILAIKKTVADMLKNLEYKEIKSALNIGILSLLLLPLVPDIVDPIFGVINIRVFFTFLVLVLFLSFLAYMALKNLGPTQGLITFSFIGAIINSEAVTANLVKISKTDVFNERRSYSTIAGGVLLANTTMIIRTFFLTWLLLWNQLDLIALLAIVLAPPILIGLAKTLYVFKKRDSDSIIQLIELKSPLSYGTALRFSLIFAFISFTIVGLERLIPSIGLYLGSFLGGFISNIAVVLSVVSLYTAGKISINQALYSIIFGTIAAISDKIIYAKAEGADSKLIIRIVLDIILLITITLAGTYLITLMHIE